MKNTLISLLIFCLLVCNIFAQAQTIDIRTKDVQMTLTVGADNKLYQSYFGKRLNDDKYEFARKKHEAYIAWGSNDLFEPALRITHIDGNPALVPTYVSHHSSTDANGTILTQIELKDSLYPVAVTLFYMAYPNENVIRTWSEIKHNQKGTITLNNFASSMLHFDAKQYWLTQFHGDWAAEMRMQESSLTSGIKIIDSKLGTRAQMYQTPVFMLSLDNAATETNGELLMGTLEWSGNFQFLFEIDNLNSLRIISGMNPFASEYYLPAGKTFTTPAFIFTYSTEGKGKASRDLHRWARKYGVLDGTKSRMTLLNNWEATYFDFNEEKLKRLFADAKKIGVDLFLLDDGWFANKYPRNNDRAGLGDWQVNKEKLPNGIGALIKEANAQGVKFGIWIEPEMVNPKSELYEKNPDWIVRLPKRAEHYYRNQMVLDVANPKVQDFIYTTVDNLLTENPEIAYIKWDANRMMTNTFSPYLKNRQSHIFIDYQLGLYNVLDRLRKKYPHLPMMLCAGGGGRVDYGALKYFTEFWPSDNTDGLERVYIQWGYSYFFPAVAMSAHVTSWGKQPIKFRTDVAMSGRVGFDIDISTLTEQELEFCQKSVENYKRLDNVIMQGDLYRLISPYDEDRAVLMYVDDKQDKAVLFSYTTNPRFAEQFSPVRLQGLDPKKTYNVKEINVFGNARSIEFSAISGDRLMNEGVFVSSTRPVTSRVFEITSSSFRTQ
ncbi:MAG: alpha-galactosidase [Bacteroidales bacterium]|jgi:alpha-galactosidase|nr:alpha-galactosidase [Bacteroidales bacterium]